MIRILFTHYGDNQIRGSERCLLDLIKHLDRDRFEPVVWCNTEKMAEAARALGVPVIRSEFSLLLSGRSPQFDLRGFYSLVKEGLRLTREYRIDLIHANSGAPNQWLNLVARIRKLPLLSHLHSRYPLRERLTLGLHHTSLAVGVSHPVVDQLIDDGIPDSRVRVISNGIDLTEFAPNQGVRAQVRRQYGVGDEPWVAMVCRYHPLKGVNEYLAAVKQLRDAGCTARFALAGTGMARDNAELSALLQRHQLGEDSICLLGEIARPQDFLPGLDLLVQASWREGTPNILLEAMACGVAMVATNVGDSAHILQDGDRLVPAGDSAALAAAIEKALNSDDNGERVAHERKYLQEHYETEVCMQAYRHSYGQLVGDAA